MSTKQIFLISAGLLLASSVSAAVYKSIDENGNVVYTDEPVGDAQPITLPPLSTVPPPRRPAPAPAPAAETADPGYKTLQIATPAQDETVRDNTGNVVVRVAIDPSLDKPSGHRLQYFLDGQKHGDPSTSEQLMFPNLERGAHTVEVAIIDANGNELKRSAGNRFFLHRQSVNFPTGPGSPTPAPLGRR